MKNIKTVAVVILLLSLSFASCDKEEIKTANQYKNELSFPDQSNSHSKNERFQNLLDNYVAKGIIGASIYIKDGNGTWLGSGGSADLASNIPMEVHHQFLIASNSKMYTATVIFSLIDEGILNFEDPINQWIDHSITDKIGNGNEAKIKHLLGHTSGIQDYYTVAFEMARYNTQYNQWTAEEILAYIYGKKAYFNAGQHYAYSNTNYLLLGMIAEKASGKNLKEVYRERIFEPLGLNNSYFDILNNAAPPSLVKGYISLYGGGYVESEFLYKDELGTGDGGIATTAQDLGLFIDNLMHRNIVSNNSLALMQDWFDIGEGGKNGFGLEYFTDDHGVSYGHTGGVDGFSSFVNYYPEQDVTFIRLYNFLPGSQAVFEAANDLERDLRKVIFE